MKPLMVFERIDASQRTDLFTFMGVRIQATRYALLALPDFILLGLFLAMLRPVSDSPSPILLAGIGYGIALYASNGIHSFGHIVAGRFVRAPMDILLLTATRDVNVYLNDQSATPKRVRIMRSVGGPLSNLVAALAGLFVMQQWRSEWLEIFAYVNGAVGLWTLCPVPTLDGWVIWRNILGSRRAA